MEVIFLRSFLTDIKKLNDKKLKFLSLVDTLAYPNFIRCYIKLIKSKFMKLCLMIRVFEKINRKDKWSNSTTL